MDNPDVYIVINKGELPDDDNFETGSNFEWVLQRAKERAEVRTGVQTIYKLVPVTEVSLEITTKVITKDLSQP